MAFFPSESLVPQLTPNGPLTDAQQIVEALWQLCYGSSAMPAMLWQLCYGSYALTFPQNFLLNKLDFSCNKKGPDI